MKPHDFIDLLKITNCIDVPLANPTYQDLVELTQEKWLRPLGRERWDLTDTDLFKEKRNEILSIVEKLGFIKEIRPSGKAYEAVLLLSASDINLIKRINYLTQLMFSGIHYKKVYFLTGGIVMLHDDNYFHELNLKTNTDTELIETLYKQSPLSKLDVEVISIKAKKKRPRPNTEDTIRAWVEKNTQEKKLLVISNQPFVLYQDKVIKRVLGDLHHVETVGDQIEPLVKIAVLLDTIARYFYECALRS